MQLKPPPIKLALSDGTVHASAHRLASGAIETSTECWAYALAFRLNDRLGSARSARAVVTAELEVIHGRVGVGCLNLGGDAYLMERFADAAHAVSRRIVLRVPASGISDIVFRNASSDGASRFQVVRLAIDLEDIVPSPYPVDVLPREVFAEPLPPGGGVIVFNDEPAAALNRARMDFIQSLALPLEGRRVLDVGAGIGHFAEFYRRMGATVVAIEGRPENVDEMRRLYPQVEAHVGDVQRFDLTSLGQFDVVHCFGLLYHVDSPVAVLRQMECVCRDILLLETIVCDSSRTIMVLADETRAVNQALAGIGSRPSPSFLVMALNRLGFPFVYGTTSPPSHPDFRFEWRDTFEFSRDGHNLRCIFVASRHPMIRDSLTALIEPLPD